MTLTIITLAGAFSYAFFTLEDDMNQKLEAKRILLPTEYYAAPYRFHTPSLQTVDKSERTLKNQNYRSRDWQQRLLPGDFLKANAPECRALFRIAEDVVFTTCLAFVKKDVEPGQAQNDIRILLFDPEGRIQQIFKAFPLETLSEIQLEPTLVAQYVGIDPIMQEEQSLGKVPPYCSNGVMAIEDPRFLEHQGVNYKGIFRALIKNISSGRAAQGGSTITQQLVKNYFLTSEKTIKRKMQEFVMAYMLESRFSKDQILETYLNIIYMGQNGPFQVRGFGAAAKFYFNKDISSLNLSDCSLLAAIVNSPGLYNPFKQPIRAFNRRNLVLDKMVEHGYISTTEAENAKKIPLPTAQPRLATETAPYYLDAVRKQLQALNIEAIGAKIYTAMDLESQQFAQEALKGHLEKLEAQNKLVKAQKEKGQTLEGAILSADAATGLIQVAVGGRNYRLTQFNRAIDGHRQVGSTMKPFVYLAALQTKDKEGKEFTPISPLKDEKFTVKYEGQTWSPSNYGNEYFGMVPMFFALKSSLNASTASLGLEVGLDRIINITQSLGVTSELKAFPSVTLGAFELYPKEVLQAYITLSRMGSKPDLSFVQKVVSSKGEEVFNFIPRSEQVQDEIAVASLVSMMKQTILSGTARYVSASGFTRPAAGKTGTTSDSRDVWFSGFTPYRTTIVWIGYDTSTQNKLTGSSGAVPIWTDFMKRATAEDPETDFPWPEGTTLVKFDENKLREMNVPMKEPLPEVELVFRKGTQPGFFSF
ncbi:transglycosylase domain-containing protein [Bdellovibrio sp. HCB337]|uniref:transglycosylase domain-containing protein n=1 Tax=Bdellovibrio sp. HCB337 TaxID=3394358 RepID=UPI0039A75F59